MSEKTKTPSGNIISNVPIENVLAGKHFDGSTGPVPSPGPVEIVREPSEAGGESLHQPDGLFEIVVLCDDLQLRLHLLRELRYFLNDPERSIQFLPRIKDALKREEQNNTTIPK